MKRKFLSISGGFLSIFLLFGCMSEKEIKRAAADDLGPVDLRPGMTFGELKKVLREETPEVLGGGVSRNVTQVAFRHRMVYASFLRDNFDLSSPPDSNARPIELSVYSPFKGTICGMSIGMTYDDALQRVRKFYPHAQIEIVPIYNVRQINLEGTPQDTWYLERCTLQDRGDTLDGVKVRASGYTTIPG